MATLSILGIRPSWSNNSLKELQRSISVSEVVIESAVPKLGRRGLYQRLRSLGSDEGGSKMARH
jgi:hypothetical protein